MVFIRKIKKKSGTYLAEVEGYRVNGKVKQRVIKYLGKEINGKAEKRVLASEIKVKNVKRSLDVLAVDAIARELSLTTLKTSMRSPSSIPKYLKSIASTSLKNGYVYRDSGYPQYRTSVNERIVRVP